MRLSKNVKEVILNNWKEEKHLNIEQRLSDQLTIELVNLFEKQFSENIDICIKHKDIKEYLKTHSNFETRIRERLDFYQQYTITCKTYVNKSTWSCSDIKEDEEYKAILSRYLDLWNEYKNQKQIISNVMDSVTTVKKLIDILPEIEKYIPKTASTTTLVASGDLVKCKAAL